jgi:hypothetical protein
MGIQLALVLGDAHYGIGGKEGKTGATTKFTTATPLPTVAARSRASEVPYASVRHRLCDPGAGARMRGTLERFRGKWNPASVRKRDKRKKPSDSRFQLS